MREVLADPSYRANARAFAAEMAALPPIEPRRRAAGAARARSPPDPAGYADRVTSVKETALAEMGASFAEAPGALE